MANPLAIAKRIATMSPDEIRTRAGMMLRQRLDGWEAGRGKNPLDPGEAGSATGRFFFDAGNVTALAAEVRARLPEEAEGVIESALRIERGEFDLLGYRGLRFGEDGAIDWHSDPVNGIRSPYLPWRQVPYLDFQKTGDHKVVWELSRHQILMLLARASVYSGEDHFLHSLERLWRDWRKANPYPYGINWTSALEVAFRCLSWIWVDHFTAGARAFSGDLRRQMRQAIGESAVYIERYISTYFAPNTHLLGEAMTLFFVGVLYPGFRRASHWREYGWRIVQQESVRQVRADGFHFEQSIYYHVYALEMFLYARILAARNGMPIPADYDAVITRMAEGLATVGMAGQAPRFGDDDGGRLFDGRRNRPEFMLDPLAAAAIVYDRPAWKTLAGGLREETIWLLGVDGIQDFERFAGEPAPVRSRGFRDSGYYVLASSQRNAVIVDGGPHGWGRGGHGHADALSLQWIVDGHARLTDPGTCLYPKDKPERDRFRGTAAHNTLEVDGLSQADPIHSFAWKSLPKTTVHRWYEGRTVTIFHGSHDGYRRLEQPVTHERWVIALPDGVWLVRDVATGDGKHRLDVRWHFGPGEPASISVTSDGTWTRHVEQAPWSPTYGSAMETSVLRMTREGPLPAECGALLCLCKGNGELSFESTDACCSYRFPGTASETVVVFATKPGMWSYSGIDSDARVFAFAMIGDAIAPLFAVHVEHVSIRGKVAGLPAHGRDVYEW